MRIVLDTNVLVASISRYSPYYWIWEAFIQKRYDLCVTTDILNEYAEIIERLYSPIDAENTLTQINLSTNVVPIVRYFEWNAITQDPDDDKFFDCAVAANADYLVSEDKHFNVLRTLAFPKIHRLKTTEFKKVLG